MAMGLALRAPRPTAAGRGLTRRAVRRCAAVAAAAPTPAPRVTETAVAVAGVAARWARAASAWATAPAPGMGQVAQVAGRGARLAGAAAAPCFAVMLQTSSGLPLITGAVASFIKLYLLLLFVRVLLTWFPTVDWMSQPWLTLRQVTDPYLNLFRNLIPPIMGQIDFTPILGFIVLQFLAGVLTADDPYSI